MGKGFPKNAFPITVFQNTLSKKTVFQKRFPKNAFPKTVFQKRSDQAIRVCKFGETCQCDEEEVEHLQLGETLAHMEAERVKIEKTTLEFERGRLEVAERIQNSRLRNHKEGPPCKKANTKAVNDEGEDAEGDVVAAGADKPMPPMAHDDNSEKPGKSKKDEMNKDAKALLERMGQQAKIMDTDVLAATMVPTFTG